MAHSKYYINYNYNFLIRRKYIFSCPCRIIKRVETLIRDTRDQGPFRFKISMILKTENYVSGVDESIHICFL